MRRKTKLPRSLPTPVKTKEYATEEHKKLLERRQFFHKQALMRRAVEAERQNHADKSLYLANLVNAGATPAVAEYMARKHFA